MSILPWLLASSLFVAPSADSAPPYGASPFALEGQLEIEAPERSNGRFSVRAQLLPATLPSREEGGRFVLSAKLQSKGAEICPAGDDLFANGFESP